MRLRLVLPAVILAALIAVPTRRLFRQEAAVARTPGRST